MESGRPGSEAIASVSRRGERGRRRSESEGLGVEKRRVGVVGLGMGMEGDGFWKKERGLGTCESIW